MGIDVGTVGSVRAARAGERGQYAGAATLGFVFVLLELAGAVVLATAGTVPAAGGASAVAGYLAQHRGAFLADSWIFSLGAVIFLRFVAGLGLALDRGAPGSRVLITVLGGSWSALVTVSAALLGAAALLATGSTSIAAVALRDLGGVIFGTVGLFPMAALMLLTSLLVLRTHALPVWVAYVGVLTGVANLIATLALFAGDSGSFFSVNGLAAQVLGGFAYILWTAVASAGLMTLRTAD
jgi:hypothetical protein